MYIWTNLWKVKFTPPPLVSIEGVKFSRFEKGGIISLYLARYWNVQRRSLYTHNFKRLKVFQLRMPKQEHSRLILKFFSLFPKKMTPSFFKLWTMNTECKILQLEILCTGSNLICIAFRLFISEHLNMNTAIWTWKMLAFFQKIWPLLFFKLRTLNTEGKILDLKIFSTCSNLNWIAFRFFLFLNDWTWTQSFELGKL